MDDKFTLHSKLAFLNSQNKIKKKKDDFINNLHIPVTFAHRGRPFKA